MSANRLLEFANLYDKLGLGQDTGGTNSLGWRLPSIGYDRNAARAQWAERMAGGGREMPNFFGGSGQPNQMPQFNTPMPNNPYSQRVDQFQQPDPVQGEVKNYLAQLFRKPNNSTVGIRG